MRRIDEAVITLQVKWRKLKSLIFAVRRNPYHLVDHLACLYLVKRFKRRGRHHIFPFKGHTFIFLQKEHRDKAPERNLLQYAKEIELGMMFQTPVYSNVDKVIKKEDLE